MHLQKGLFKRESRGPYALPIDLSNLLGIKKDKLIEILSSIYGLKNIYDRK